MDTPSDEDAWGEFKSTTEQGDNAGALSTTAAGLAEVETDERDQDEPPPSVVHQQYPAGEVEESESAAGGKEDEHTSTDTVALAGLPMLQSAAEVREESNEMMNVKAAQSQEQQQQQQQPQPQQQYRDDDNSGSGVDLLNLLPSPTAAASGASTGGESLDLFGLMLASAPPENPIHKLPAADSSGSGSVAGIPVEASHQGDPTDDSRGVSASPDGENSGRGDGDGEWGVFEQPGAEDDRDPTPKSLAAEKVDGEWIDLAGSGSDQPGEGKEDRATAVDDEKGGDEGNVSVGREEHEPHLEAQQQQQPGESLMGDLGCHNEGDLLVESDAGGSATKAATLGAATPPAGEKPGVKADDEEPHPADEGREEEMNPPSAGPATAASVEGDVPRGSAGATVAVPAPKPSELESSVTSVAVAGKAEGGGGEGNVAGASERGSPSGSTDAAGVAEAGILDWGDFGGPAAAAAAAAAADDDEATAVDGAGAESPESVDGIKPEGPAKEDEEPSCSAVPDATGAAAANVLDWGDFGGPAPASAVDEATAVDGAAAASSESVDGEELERRAKEDEGASRSAAPRAAGVAAADVVDWDDFGGPASASAVVEATAVDGAAAGSSPSAEGNAREGQAKEDKEPGHSAAADAIGVAAADVPDWGHFGSPNSAAVEAAAVDGAAAASSESADENEQGGQAKEDEVPGEEEEEDEWSAFEAPPTPSAALSQGAAQGQEISEPLPRAADETLFSADFSPPAAESGVQEESKDGSPESPPPTQAKGAAGRPEGLVTSGVGEACDNVAVEGRQSPEAVVPPAAAPAVDWGVFGEAERTEPSAEEPSVERAGGDDKTPPVDDALPAAMPELVGGSGVDGSSSWGAFDEAPPAAAAVEAEAPAAVPAPTDEIATESGGISAPPAGGVPATQAGEGVAEESAAAAKEEDLQAAAPKEAGAPPSAAGGAEADATEVEGNTGGGGGGDQEPEESEDDWGSDFGDFEEAPTTDEPAPAASTASMVTPPAVVAFPKPPASAARSLPAVGPAVGAGGAAAATVQGATPGGTADTFSGDARVAAGGGASPSPLAAMVAVFDGAFGGAAAAAASRKWPSVSGGAGDGEGSLDSLADLALLLAHAKPSRRRAPTRLNEWAKSCILRGIRPVPDALSLPEDDSDQDAGHSSRARGHGSVSVGFEAQPSSTPAVRSPRVSPAVEARQSGAAAAERPASSSPLASSADLSRSSSAETSPRAVSPSSAPRPLPRKASATVGPPPGTEPIASPPPPPPPPVLGESASAQTTTSRAVSPSGSPPPLPRKSFPVVEPPPTEPVAGRPQPADASSDAAVVKAQAGLEANATTAAVTATTTTAAVIESEETSAFAAFPSSPEPAGENAASDEDEFVWSEAAAITPEMPRHPPPRVPMTPPAVGGESPSFNDKEGSSDNSSTDVRASTGGSSGGGGDEIAPAVAVGGDSAASAGVDVDGGGGDDGGGDDDDDDWSDDPFDSFQSAPPASSLAPPPPPSRGLEGYPHPATTAAAADTTSSPSPPADASPWSLDFLMGAPATGGAGDGRVSPAPSAGFGAGMPPAAEGVQSGKPLDLVSQALAGFGIAASATPETSQENDGDDDFLAFSGVGGATAPPSSSSNIQGGILSGGGLKGERDRVSSVDVSDLLRAARLRGGGRRVSRPPETLSAAAEARLSALPDLSYMLSQRIRFPMRAAEPLPATATGEGFL